MSVIVSLPLGNPLTLGFDQGGGGVGCHFGKKKERWCYVTCIAC